MEMWKMTTDIFSGTYRCQVSAWDHGDHESLGEYQLHVSEMQIHNWADGLQWNRGKTPGWLDGREACYSWVATGITVQSRNFTLGNLFQRNADLCSHKLLHRRVTSSCVSQLRQPCPNTTHMMLQHHKSVDCFLGVRSLPSCVWWEFSPGLREGHFLSLSLQSLSQWLTWGCGRLFLVSLSLFFLTYLLFNWRIIALQNFATFCQPSTWISRQCT